MTISDVKNSTRIIKAVTLSLFGILSIWMLAAFVLLIISPGIIFKTERGINIIPDTSIGWEMIYFRNNNDKQIEVLYADNPDSNVVVMYLHGNSGRIMNQFNDLTTKYDVYSPAYPGFHGSEGEPNTKSVTETAEYAYNKLGEMGYSADNIIIYGHSLGGSAATYVSSNHPESPLLLLNVFDSIQSMCQRSYSIFCIFSGSILPSHEYASNIQGKVHQYHYDQDPVVPYAEGQKLFEAIPSSDKEFTTIHGYNHNDPEIPLVDMVATLID